MVAACKAAWDMGMYSLPSLRRVDRRVGLRGLEVGIFPQVLCRSRALSTITVAAPSTQ